MIANNLLKVEMPREHYYYIFMIIIRLPVLHYCKYGRQWLFVRSRMAEIKRLVSFIILLRSLSFMRA